MKTLTPNQTKFIVNLSNTFTERLSIDICWEKYNDSCDEDKLIFSSLFADFALKVMECGESKNCRDYIAFKNFMAIYSAGGLAPVIEFYFKRKLRKFKKDDYAKIIDIYTILPLFGCKVNSTSTYVFKWPRIAQLTDMEQQICEEDFSGFEHFKVWLRSQNIIIDDNGETLSDPDWHIFLKEGAV